MSKSIKTYFDMNAGVYCGLLLEKRLAIRMSKLLLKQQQEIKELLAANIEETEVSEWTLAYPDGEQKSVIFFNPDATVRDKMRRVELLSKGDLIKKVDKVFMAKSMKEAEAAFLAHEDKMEFLGQEKTN